MRVFASNSMLAWTWNGSAAKAVPCSQPTCLLLTGLCACAEGGGGGGYQQQGGGGYGGGGYQQGY